MFKYEISDMCKKCVKDHIKNKQSFKVKCTPVPKEMMDKENPFFPLDKVYGEGVFDKKEALEVQLKKNIIGWAKEMLNWSPQNDAREYYQFYQAEMLTCTAKLKVGRLGRRLGKTEALTVKSLHYALTDPNKTVMIIGPFQNLIDEIFDRITSLLDGDNSAFQGMYERKRQPNIIRFKNGSQIKGFTTGQNGDSIRGQSADLLIFDEAAYIPPTAFRAVLALLLDNPNVGLIATSTPSALETNFKKWCKEDVEFKEFHVPTTVVPYFHDLEKTLKSTYTSDDYGLEVLAEFIEGSSKVFKSHNILAASKEYRYLQKRSDLEKPNDWIISIGVDYNEHKNGVQCVVLGLNKYNTDKPFKILKRVSIQTAADSNGMKKTQTTGVDTIKQLYHDFEANYVYVDQGHGSMQNEILSEYFFNINKPEVFKGVDFSSNYSFENLYTGEIVKKRMKVMMINFLQKRFEMEDIIISKTEESEKGMLIKQLMEYYIVRFDSKDQPIFAGVDHILDGLMLANFAIIENNDALFNRKTGMYVASIRKDEKESFVSKEEGFKRKPFLEAVDSNPKKETTTLSTNTAENFEFITGPKTIKKQRKTGIDFKDRNYFGGW